MVDDRVELLSLSAEEEEKLHSPSRETDLNASAAETFSFPQTCERRLQAADRHDITPRHHAATSRCDNTNNSLNFSSELEQNRVKHFSEHEHNSFLTSDLNCFKHVTSHSHSADDLCQISSTGNKNITFGRQMLFFICCQIHVVTCWSCPTRRNRWTKLVMFPVSGSLK